MISAPTGMHRVRIEYVGDGVLDAPQQSLHRLSAVPLRSPRDGPPFVGYADIFPRYRGKSTFTQGRLDYPSVGNADTSPDKGRQDTFPNDKKPLP